MQSIPHTKSLPEVLCVDTNVPKLLILVACLSLDARPFLEMRPLPFCRPRLFMIRALNSAGASAHTEGEGVEGGWVACSIGGEGGVQRPPSV